MTVRTKWSSLSRLWLMVWSRTQEPCRVPWGGSWSRNSVSPAMVALGTQRLLCLWSLCSVFQGTGGSFSHSEFQDLGATSTSPFAVKGECLEIHRDSSWLTQFAVPDGFGFPQYWPPMGNMPRNFQWKEQTWGLRFLLKGKNARFRKNVYIERFFLITTWLFSLHENILEL